jgi:hypothetical protein
MKWLMGTYTKRFNARHKVFGHLFSGRYKALIWMAAATFWRYGRHQRVYIIIE